MFDQAIRFPHQASLRVVEVPSETFVVLEDREHLRVAKKLSKEPQFADGQVGDARRQLDSLNGFIDHVILISFGEKPFDFPSIVISGFQFSRIRRFDQFGVRTAVRQCQCDGITCISG